jgi:glycine cleavage system H protein
MSMIRFTKEHEWIRIDDAVAVVGITDYAQRQLGDVVFVELPEVGKHLIQGGEAGVVESVKAASEVYAPASGEVVAINDALADEPGRVNADALGEGWFFKVKLSNPDELSALMDATGYQAYLATLE